MLFPIKDYEGLYSIDILRMCVWSHTSNKYLKNILSGPNSDYYQVRLYNNGIGKTYKIHRLLYCAYNNCEIPDGYVIDHINNNSLDNRSDNLRLATINQNNSNRKLGKNNTTGYKNVSYAKHTNSYKVQITSNGNTHTSYHKDLIHAVNTADRVRLLFHKSFTNNGFGSDTTDIINDLEEE